MRRFIAYLSACIFAAGTLNAQNPRFSVNANLVQVPVTVFDNNGRPAKNLDASDFSISMDGIPQELAGCQNDTSPLTLAIVLDRSQSMEHNLLFVGQAADEIVMRSVDPLDDETMLVVFDNTPFVAMSFKSDKEGIYRFVKGNLYETNGGTALFDAVYLAINRVKANGSKDPPNRHRAVLLITDGGDNHSRYTEKELLAFLREADVPVYAIKARNSNLFDTFFPDKHGKMVRPHDQLGPDEIRGPANLQKLADATGGGVFTAYTPENIPRVAAVVDEAMRHAYTCSFKPVGIKETKDGVHKIQLKMNREGLWPPSYKRSVIYRP